MAKRLAKTRVAALASGGGSNLQALLKACRDPSYPAEIVLVLANRADAFALERGRQAGIHSVYLNPAPFASANAYDGEVLRLLRQERVEAVCLAGYLRILTPVLVRAYAGRILNMHPALLPKFGGKGMYGLHVHQAVLAAGEQESGCSVHLVDEGVDTGAILLQARVPVLPGDSAESLAQRVLEQEHRIYPQALRAFCQKLRC